MKTYHEMSSLLKELFDTAHPWDAWQTGGREWIYRFALAKVKGGKYVSCPPMGGDSIEKFYAAHGIKITGRDNEGRPLLNGKDIHTPLPGVIYDVTFQSFLQNKDAYAPLRSKAGLSDADMERMFEIGFSRIDSILKWSFQPRPVAAGSAGAKWYWDYDRNTGTDDDLAIMGVADASKVFGTIIDISKSFIDKANPSGILIGTKTEAKEARGRIYKGMAARKGGTVIPIPYAPRPGMKNANMIWLDKTRKFDPLGGKA